MPSFTFAMRRFFLGMLTALACPVFACRIIIDPPYPPPIRPIPPAPRLDPMRVKEHRVTVDIAQQIARVHVQATFHNPNNRRIEGTYWFPIAADAVVSSFAVTVNGKTLEAELLPADKARKIYEDIVRRKRDPAILEYIDQGMLRARVFPIEPRSDVRIELVYEQRISRDGVLSRAVYPLLSARPAGRENRIETLVIDVNVQVRGPLKTVITPGYDSQVSRLDDHRARITYEAHDYLPTRDFEVVLSESGGPVGVDMLTYRKGDDGYFMLLVAPASELQAQEIRAKDIVFVLDTSGSMSGKKLAQARKAIRYCIEHLSDHDFFNVVAFSTDVTPFGEKSVSATPTARAAALDFVAGLRAGGGTAIDDALQFSLRSHAAADAVPLVVFLTDGRPTIGEVDADAIIRHFKTRATRARVYTFGVGYDVNTKLLDSVAGASRGYTSYVKPQQDLELALSGFYAKVASPVLTDLRLDSGDVRLSAMSPTRLPDLFKGGQVTAFGRYHGKGDVKMRVSGEIGGVREVFPFPAKLDGDPRNSFIPRMWAISRVGQLLEQVRLHGTDRELVDEIKRLGRAYGILTPYTSFLVVEEGLAEDARRQAREELDGLMSSTGTAGPSGEMAVHMAEAEQAMRHGAATDFDTSEDAGFYGARVQQRLSSIRKRLRPMPSNRPMDEAGRARGLRDLVVKVGDKTFYFRVADGFYYDSVIAAGETPAADIEIKAWSDAFFALLTRRPELRRYLRVGDRLVVVLDGVTIRITD